ncbi:hypothetical protein L227DRAFT_575039 [Lentinus tigrinus ALCF2SS1-6]|uniref:Uncharacterized protein n=1 Tax=Lentinus tigrinus ALCF2SS1-6 TaxID=1328759 RepID=A0A5C2SAM4_9APHY|nr:hypothetical protein L227DRAFT_575039 [Lentinus tigrinus ALCF2SS1-6]
MRYLRARRALKSTDSDAHPFRCGERPPPPPPNATNSRFGQTHLRRRAYSWKDNNYAEASGIGLRVTGAL